MGHFARFLASHNAGSLNKDVAAQMGVAPSQLTKAKQGRRCNMATYGKIILGISEDERTRAQALAALLCDFRECAGPKVAAMVSVTVHV